MGFIVFPVYIVSSKDICHRLVISLYDTNPSFNDIGKWAFENIVGKGENAGNQHFLLFLPCLLNFSEANLTILSTLKCSS